MLLLRGLARLQRLQADRRGVEDRGREGRRRPATTTMTRLHDSLAVAGHLLPYACGRLRGTAGPCGSATGWTTAAPWG